MVFQYPALTAETYQQIVREAASGRHPPRRRQPQRQPLGGAGASNPSRGQPVLQHLHRLAARVASFASDRSS